MSRINRIMISMWAMPACQCRAAGVGVGGEQLSIVGRVIFAGECSPSYCAFHRVHNKGGGGALHCVIFPWLFRLKTSFHLLFDAVLSQLIPFILGADTPKHINKTC